MACQTTPHLLVPSPDAQTPPDPRFGLLSVSALIEQMPDHAHNGVMYETVCDPKVRLYEVDTGCPDPAPEPAQKQGDRSASVTKADPFAVYAVEQCLDGRTSQQMQTALRRRLLRGERHVVEAAVYHGLAGASPYLRHEDTTVINNGAPLPLAAAVGALEQRLALAGRTATIHAPRWMAAAMDAEGLLHRQGPHLRTILGTPIAFGSAYTGHPPQGTEDEQAWLYATGPVTVRRSEVIEPARLDQGAFNIRTNTPFVLVERVYVVDWPCGTAAVPTTLPRVEVGIDLDSIITQPPATPEP